MGIEHDHDHGAGGHDHGHEHGHQHTHHTSDSSALIGEKVCALTLVPLSWYLRITDDDSTTPINTI